MRRRSAFTLVEMLVALAVTSILTILMLRMFSDSSTIWKKHDEKLDTFREARAALQLMARELGTLSAMPEVSSAQSVTPPTSVGGNDQYPVLALKERVKREAASPDAPVPKDLSDFYYKKAYALVSVPNTGKSDLCAIGYYLEWDTTPNAQDEPRNAFVLKRQGANSDKTFALMKNTLQARDPFFGTKAFSILYDPAQLPPDGVQPVATYIWDLQFSLPERAPNGLLTNGVPQTIPTVPPGTASDVYFGRELPSWIEIRFRALGSAAAGKLYGQGLTESTWKDTDSSTYQRLILPSEQQFVSRVKLAR